MPEPLPANITFQRRFTIAGAVTGIGSLPLTSVDSAIQTVAECSPEIPFWPQLPQLSPREGAIGQGLGILADLIEPRTEGYGYQVKDGRIDSVLAILHRSSGRLMPENAAGFNAFKNATFPQAVAVKGHIEGPITLATYLFHNGRPFLADPALFAALAFHVSQIIHWQIDSLTPCKKPILLFIDEPALCLDIQDDRRLNALAKTLDTARQRGALAGLHCCAASPFERMYRADPDLVSFDAHEGLESFFDHPQTSSFIRKGGYVAYGLVPTWPSLDSLDSLKLFARWLAAASLSGDPQDLAQRAMITATCGLGLLDQSAIHPSFNLARAVGKLMRKLAVY